MAVTRGHGNPDWTRDEVILALELYFACEGRMPASSDPRVEALSELLRSFPQHHVAARRETFRNPDGVAFKLQNLRQVATGKGLGNVSRTDRAVWNELGDSPERTKELAALIRKGVVIIETATAESSGEDEFLEGMVVTETHVRRERDPRLRKLLLAQRHASGSMSCDICQYTGDGCAPALRDASFEAHHILPLSTGKERKTRVRDLALLCANCHRMAHRAIALEKRWLTLDEVRVVLLAPLRES